MDFSDFKFVDVSEERIINLIEDDKKEPMFSEGKTEEQLRAQVIRRLNELEQIRKKNFDFLQSQGKNTPKKIEAYYEIFGNFDSWCNFDIDWHLNLHLKEPVSYLDAKCEKLLKIVRENQLKNSQLSFQQRKEIRNTWNQLFGDAIFDLNLISRGSNSYNGLGYDVRVLKDYKPIYEEGKVVKIDSHHLHPQTIGNIVKPNERLVDIIRINSSQTAVNRINRALISMGLQTREDLQVSFPLHNSDDYCGGGPDYTIDIKSVNGESSNIIDNLPLIVVQQDFGKGKYNYYALEQLQERGFFVDRTIFHYVMEIKSNSSDRPSFSELNKLNFFQVSQRDLSLIKNKEDLVLYEPHF